MLEKSSLCQIDTDGSSVSKGKIMLFNYGNQAQTKNVYLERVQHFMLKKIDQTQY